MENFAHAKVHDFTWRLYCSLQRLPGVICHTHMLTNISLHCHGFWWLHVFLFLFASPVTFITSA